MMRTAEPPVAATTDDVAASTRRDPRRALALLRRVPATATLLAALLAVGVATGGLWTSTTAQPWYALVAYGLPAFEAGRWWTPATGTLLVTEPWGYALLAVLVPASIGWLEWQRGSRAAVSWFAWGQLAALGGAALLVLVAAPAGSGWATELATVLDVGPSGGLFACLAAVACTLPPPWRGRAQLVLAAFTVVSLMFLGTLADLEHAVAVALALGMGHRTIVRPSVRERRFVAWVMLVSLVAIQIVISLVPTFGPFGASTPSGITVGDVALDAVLVLGVANGLRRGYRAAWVGAIVLSVLNVLVGALAVTALVVVPAAVAQYRDELSIIAASAALWLVALAALVAMRTAFRARIRRRIPAATTRAADDVRRIVQTTGGGPLSWMATWRDNAHLIGASGDTVVAHQVHAGVAIALSDPIARPEELRSALADWIDAAERAGLVACVFAASQACRDQAPAGWRALQVAEDTIVDLPGLSFTGKRWNTVRTATNRAAREGVTFRLTTLASEPAAVRRQIDAISEQWVGDKGLPEMRFTLGTVEEALDPAVRLALAEGPDGAVEGFLSWLPVHGPGGAITGWTLDLMRRRDGGFPPVMEFLIAASAAAFSEEGAATASLSGAPLARSDTAAEGVIERLLDRLGGMLEPVYGFRSLHRFKQKFHPRAEPLFLLYADEGDLPAIGVALARAFLPDASMRELVRASAGVVTTAAHG